jgi:hypothetical protein
VERTRFRQPVPPTRLVALRSHQRATRQRRNAKTPTGPSKGAGRSHPKHGRATGTR